MKIVALLCFLIAVTSAALVSDELFAEIKAKATWEAVQDHPRFEGMSVEELQMTLLGASDISIDSSLPVLTHEPMALPTDFDVFQGFNITSPLIKNQEKCGSCWAFSASSTLGYRFAIKENVDPAAVNLSPQSLVSCDWLNMGCNGGMLPTAWLFMELHGLPTESCYPYASGDGSKHSCSKHCTSNDTDDRRYHAHSQYHVKHVDDIKSELVKNGPVQAAFTVYADFMTYKSGVYVHTTGQELGGHAITIVGYGEENGEEYFLVQNSWGTGWGIEIAGKGGFFKIRTDQCGIAGSVRGGAAGKISKP